MLLSTGSQMVLPLPIAMHTIVLLTILAAAVPSPARHPVVCPSRNPRVPGRHTTGWRAGEGTAAACISLVYLVVV